MPGKSLPHSDSPNPSHSIRAVVFDFDGVIVHSEPLHFLAFHEAAKAIGIHLTENEYYDQLVGYDDRGAWKKLLFLRDISPTPAQLLELLTFKANVMRRQIQAGHFQPTPGIQATIRTLWRQLPLAICSGAIREEIEGMLEGIQLRDCFRLITSAEDVEVGKPDPSGYLQTVAHLAKLTRTPLSPSTVLIVEDSPRVIENVKALGFCVLGVAGSFYQDKLVDAGADAVVSDLSLESIQTAIPGLSSQRQ
jgi:beta-phosphoglucomutase